MVSGHHDEVVSGHHDEVVSGHHDEVVIMAAVLYVVKFVS